MPLLPHSLLKSTLLAATLSLFSGTSVAQNKPNIIWLMAEDISTDLACYGMEAVRTPNLDAMAARGVRFDKLDTFTVQDQPFFAQIQLNVTHRGGWWDDVRAQSKHPVDPAKVTPKAGGRTVRFGKKSAGAR